MNITSLERTQATIEIVGGLVCLMISVIIMMNGQKRKSLRLLKNMFLCAMVLFFAEAFAYIFRGNTNNLSLFMTRAANFVVFTFNIVLANLFVKYIISLLKETEVEVSKHFIKVADISLYVTIGILIVNIFTGWMYFFDASNYYHRNVVWYVYTFLSLAIILMGAFLGIKYRKKMGAIKVAAIVYFAIVPISAIIIQIFSYGISVANIGIGIALLFLLFVYLVDWTRSKDVDREIEEKRKKLLDIVILFTIMVVIMSASILSCIISIKKISVENSEVDSRVIAHMVDESISNEFVKPISVSETMAYSQSMKDMLKRSAETSAEDVEEEMKGYLASIKDSFNYQMAFAVCDANGAYYSYEGISKYLDVVNDSHDIWYKEVLDYGRKYKLNVDTDEVNELTLSVFVNTIVPDDDGSCMGVCGVAVKMEALQELINQCEKNFNIKIYLANRDGLIQVESDVEKIETEYLDNSYYDKVPKGSFMYENLGKYSRLTKYMDDLDWYLVIEDRSPDKISVSEITTPSIIIFVIGLFMMALAFAVIAISEYKTSRELMDRKKASVTDELTGLLNRRAYDEKREIVENSEEKFDYVLVMLDVNGLKAANDNLGHNVGDELLLGAAHCMEKTFGMYGDVYRVGGDEFIAFIKANREQLDDAIKSFDYLVNNWKGQHIDELSISKGAVAYKEHQELTFDELKDLADKLMYEDKAEFYRRTGKDRRK